MRAVLFLGMTILKALFVVIGTILIAVNIYRAFSKKDAKGYAKALQVFLFTFGLLLLTLVLEFIVALAIHS